MAGSKEIRVPDIGDFTDVPVIEVLVSPGDTVEAEQSLVTLESDKATMEVPAPAAGRIESVALAVGDTVSEGDLVAVMEAAGGEDDGNDDGNADGNDKGNDEGAAPESGNGAGGDAAQDDAAEEEAEALEVRVPDIGDFTDVPVIEVLVSAGDEVEAEQSLVTLESDKATM
ncbi:MAG: dihydrolipoamide acetyltransferase, partial [Gammaproteobacteria bacterium]